MQKVCILFLVALVSVAPSQSPKPQATPAPPLQPLTPVEFEHVSKAGNTVTVRRAELAAAQTRLDAAQAHWRAVYDRVRAAHDCQDCSLTEDGKTLVKPTPKPKER